MTLRIIRIPRRRAYPPRISAFTQPFWHELEKGRFTTTQCPNCGDIAFPPKQHCPACWHRPVGWIELSGHGSLYSRTTIHAAPGRFAEEAPYAVCIIDLAEKVRIATRLVGDPAPALDCAMELVVLQYEDGPLFGACSAGSAA
ncbi:MAG: OB-fold domain-containing protein [Azospirillaceae bacterium]